MPRHACSTSYADTRCYHTSLNRPSLRGWRQPLLKILGTKCKKKKFKIGGVMLPTKHQSTQLRPDNGTVEMTSKPLISVLFVLTHRYKVDILPACCSGLNNFLKK